jgi:hypothetical protein
MALVLNQSLLPEEFVAEARVQLGGQVQVDVGTFAENAHTPNADSGGVAVWAPPKPAATAPLAFEDTDVLEVQVLKQDEGPRLVAAIELISPANKDRPANRRMFAVKCASYLNCGVSVILVDVVTERSGNLQTELLELLQVSVPTAGQGALDLFACACRTVPDPSKAPSTATNGQGLRLEIWAGALAVGAPLPTLPLWLQPDLCLPLDLEATYLAACAARRIAS